MFEVGQKIKIKDVCRRMSQYDLRLYFHDNFGHSGEYDACHFMRYSNVHGVFEVSQTKEWSTTYLVRLRSSEYKCKEGWWVPVNLFEPEATDWLEDLPLALHGDTNA
jgi:hypothetical protein